MKKIIVSLTVLALVIIAYFGQVAYMGNFNQKVYEYITQKNEFYVIENEEFQKGFFSSKASFDLKVDFGQLSEDYATMSTFPIKVSVVLKNNIFASDNINASFENPLYEFFKEMQSVDTDGKINLDKILAQVKASVSLSGKIKINSSFSNIDFKDKGTAFKLDNLVVQGEFDKEGKIYGANIDLGEFNFTQPSYFGIVKNFSLKNVHYEDFMNEGIELAEYLDGFIGAKSKMNIETMEFFNVVFSDIKIDSQSDINKKEADADTTLSGTIELNIKSISSPLVAIKLDDINSRLQMSNISLEALKSSQELDSFQSDTNVAQLFFAGEPIIELTHLSFNSNGKKVDAKGLFKASQTNFSANFSAQSEILFSDIFPPLKFFNIDEYFVEKDGKYVLDFLANGDLNSIKMILNGNEISENSNETLISPNETPEDKQQNEVLEKLDDNTTNQ